MTFYPLHRTGFAAKLVDERNPVMALDRRKLALIHIVKKELCLSDDEYRAILKKEAGVTSSKNLTDIGFRKLMNFLVRDKRYRIAPGGLTLKQKLFIQNLARDLGWDPDHLKNFIRKYYHQPGLENLDRKTASKLIESLKQIKAHSPQVGSAPPEMIP